MVRNVKALLVLHIPLGINSQFCRSVQLLTRWSSLFSKATHTGAVWGTSVKGELHQFYTQKSLYLSWGVLLTLPLLCVRKQPSGLSELGFEDYKFITESLHYKVEALSLKDGCLPERRSNEKMLLVALWEMWDPVILGLKGTIVRISLSLSLWFCLLQDLPNLWKCNTELNIHTFYFPSKPTEKQHLPCQYATALFLSVDTQQGSIKTFATRIGTPHIENIDY